MYGDTIDELYLKAGLSEEDIAKLSDEEKNNIINDFTYWNWLFSAAKNCRETLMYRNDVINNATRLKESDIAYISRTNKKILEKYSGKLSLTVTNENVTTNIIDNWKRQQYSDYINIVLIILVVCLLFLVEHHSNTFNMIYSSYKGRGKTYMNKIGVILVFDIVMAVMTTFLMNIFCFLYKDCGTSVKQYIQNKAYFSHSPYNLRIYQMWIVIGVFRILGYITLSLIFVFFAMFFKKSIIPFISGVVVGVCGYAIFDKIIIRMNLLQQQEYSIENILKKYNNIRMFTPYALIRDAVSYFVEYEPNNIAGYPISTVTVAIIINITYCIVFMSLGYLVYIKRFRKKY
jgi:hypothetical protein